MGFPRHSALRLILSIALFWSHSSNIPDDDYLCVMCGVMQCVGLELNGGEEGMIENGERR